MDGLFAILIIDNMETLLEGLIKCAAIGGFLAYFVFIWFETHFVIEYCSWLPIVRAIEWKEYEKAMMGAKYPYFLREKYNCWFTRLVGCPFCLIGLTTFLLALPLGMLISWWGILVIAPIASVGFLLMERLYKNVYS